MDRLGRISVLLLLAGLAAAGTWALHATAWPSYVVLGLDFVLWTTVALSSVGLLRRPEPPDRRIIEQLRTRAQRRER